MSILQKMISTGDWVDVDPSKIDFYLSRVIGDPSDMSQGGEPVSYRLQNGDFGLVNPTREWYEKLRVKPTPRTQTPTNHRFTCRRCGEHQDTTRRGHCDDCEA